jgi:mannose/fructose/N-acetylgalactosamine-specific phosphotransferase system component IIB
MGGQVHLRVDNRLLHGQVVQFWIGHLEVADLIIADDEVACNAAMPTIYRMALPEAVGLKVITVPELKAELDQTGPLTTMVLMRDIRDVLRAIGAGVVIRQITLGNVHATAERNRVTDSVYLSERETEELYGLRREGIEVEIQTFPGEILRLADDNKGETRWLRP